MQQQDCSHMKFCSVPILHCRFQPFCSLKKKILELRKLVDANIVESAEHHQLSCHRRGAGVNLRLGQEGLLNIATKNKRDYRWAGLYIVTGMKDPSTPLLSITV